MPVPTEDDGCCGISAGQTHIILINRDHAERTLPPRAVALLEERLREFEVVPSERAT